MGLTMSNLNIISDFVDTSDGKLTVAALCYLQHGDNYDVPAGWPWKPDDWNPRNYIQDLKTARAFLDAEIERMEQG